MINNKYIMGKLGNNLKSTIIVLIAILAALASLPFAANFFGIKSPAKNGGNNNMEANASTAELSDTYVSTKPSGKSLTYNGSAQQLVTDGSPKDSYWLEYSFSGDSDWVSASSITKTNAETYTIYVRVMVVQGGYNVEKEKTSFTATIGKATPVITSTDGRCVAMIRCIPAALAI